MDVAAFACRERDRRSQLCRRRRRRPRNELLFGSKPSLPPPHVMLMHFTGKAFRQQADGWITMPSRSLASACLRGPGCSPSPPRGIINAGAKNTRGHQEQRVIVNDTPRLSSAQHRSGIAPPAMEWAGEESGEWGMTYC